MIVIGGGVAVDQFLNVNLFRATERPTFTLWTLSGALSYEFLIPLPGAAVDDIVTFRCQFSGNDKFHLANDIDW